MPRPGQLNVSPDPAGHHGEESPANGTALTPVNGLTSKPRTAQEPAMLGSPQPREEVGVWSGSFSRFTSATDAMRRERLRAAAGFLLLIFSMAFLYRTTLGAGLQGTPSAAFLGVLAAILAVVLGLLSSEFRLSGVTVRGFEFTTFGLAAAYLAVRQFLAMDYWLRLDDASGINKEAEVLSTVKMTLIGTMLLTFAYCMLIPNTWRAAAKVVLLIVAVPVLTELSLYAAKPEALRSAREIVMGHQGRVTEDVVIMMIAAGLSIYGTHVINTLRTEAFEAQQLNQYQLGKKLGTGGMGEVYLAEHRLLKRPCAIKLIRPASANDPVSLRRFEREVRATARLSHPNTIEIYDYGRTERGTFYYVMEYLRGMSLDQIVKRHGPMPAERVVYLLRQVCGALAEAHEAGLIHRDVKPANIFACVRGGRYDVAKLLDFGLVKSGSPRPVESDALEVSQEGIVHGTPLYMAPEQVANDPHIDGRIDLYALGAIAYFALTGRPPFTGQDRITVMTAHARDPVAPPRQRKADIPEDLERVVLRCLAKAPEDRYQDANCLADAFDACASASVWNTEKARLWWLEFEPEAIEPPV